MFDCFFWCGDVAIVADSYTIYINRVITMDIVVFLVFFSLIGVWTNIHGYLVHTVSLGFRLSI